MDERPCRIRATGGGIKNCRDRFAPSRKLIGYSRISGVTLQLGLNPWLTGQMRLWSAAESVWSAEEPLGRCDRLSITTPVQSLIGLPTRRSATRDTLVPRAWPDTRHIGTCFEILCYQKRLFWRFVLNCSVRDCNDYLRRWYVQLWSWLNTAYTSCLLVPCQSAAITSARIAFLLFIHRNEHSRLISIFGHGNRRLYG